MSTPPAKSSSRSASPSGPSRQPNLLALGSAAVLAVYATGFLRTKAAAAQLEARSDARRRPVGAPQADAGGAASPRGETGASLPGDGATPSAPTAVASSTIPPVDSVNYRVVVKQGVAAVVAVRPTDSSTVSRGVVAAAAPTAPETAPALSVAPPPAPTGSGTSTSSTNTLAAPPEPAPAPVAPAVAAAPAPAAEAPKAVKWRDGTYTGWGTSRHGDIEATVVIEGGKITGAIISRCLTRYSCSWVAHLQPQVVTRQSPEVDNVSGATESANAFFYAVSEALAKSK